MDSQEHLWLRRAFAQCQLLDLATAANVLVTSHLDYYNALYIRLLLKMVKKLQLVQNMMDQLLYGLSRPNLQCLSSVGYHSKPNSKPKLMAGDDL